MNVDAATSADIHLRVEGRVGHATLDRPQALNALTYHMALALEQALDGWAADPDVSMVLIDAAGDRAFCAGGDIQTLYHTGRSGDLDYGRRFWADEYRLNLKIARYPKPYVALMDGIVMGGGVGISAHGSHRMVTERTMLAMPECSIGLVPDVGGTHLLAEAPGFLGEYLGLTGTRLVAADAILAGFADVFVPSDRLGRVIETLIESGDPESITRFAEDAPEGKLGKDLDRIDRIFAADTVADMVELLKPDPGGWAQATLKALNHGSPLSLACTLQLIRDARASGELGTALRHEYRYVSRCMQHGDFLEGIRAAVIDKDRTPQWRHRGIGAVHPADVAEMLAVPPGGDIEV
ncbi:enoyl-CoA hydratase [Hoeflea marina]|uniref:3-hydroxyisobutyryl-CoA hydrolase n=1 Tax=Hoeflea marina TaxID=274592 RepID=A0A317PRY2_9HYPH|nr:enoyl-CoA hydratase/isomerase family protein [Hoeflea marina]PWW03919.1 enoyl-CoA hydratase [Hoeflea marina]